MFIDEVSPNLNDPSLRSALRLVQQGQWDSGLAEFERLAKRYPADERLAALYTEMQLRARVDQDEVVDIREVRQRRFRTLASRVLAVLVVAGLAYWGLAAYSLRLEQQLAVAQQSLEQQVRSLTVSANLQNAQALLQAGRVEEALALLGELAAQNADIPELPGLLAQAETEAAIADEYNEAMRLVERQDWPAALDALNAIQAKRPNYRDVALKIEEIQERFQLDDKLAAAETDFTAGRWDAAIAGFENLQALAPSYQTEVVEERLFVAYTRAARTTLVGRSDSLEALAIAENFFRKALTLRPQDPDVKTERELARLFLQAQSDFGSGNWAAVISGLEYVFSEAPDYARGTARQTLYEAYLGRGDELMQAGEFGLALRDYQRARVIAEQVPGGSLQVYEAYRKAADAQGANENYESAVLLYRAAVELGGLTERAASDPTLAAILEEAEADAQDSRYSQAFENYQLAVRVADASLPTVTHVVQSGEYLLLIASRYRTTVQAIALVNNLENPSMIITGQTLIIPVPPED
jgi:tetratricopeptide (TPR) repeat protein